MFGAHSLSPVIDLKRQVQKSGGLHVDSQNGEDLSNTFRLQRCKAKVNMMEDGRCLLRKWCHETVRYLWDYLFCFSLQTNLKSQHMQMMNITNGDEHIKCFRRQFEVSFLLLNFFGSLVSISILSTQLWEIQLFLKPCVVLGFSFLFSILLDLRLPVIPFCFSSCYPFYKLLSFKNFALFLLILLWN